jgi:hypothetical protein
MHLTGRGHRSERATRASVRCTAKLDGSTLREMFVNESADANDHGQNLRMCDVRESTVVCLVACVALRSQLFVFR